MDESNCRPARRRPGPWTRSLGLVSLSLWLAACAPLPVALAPEDALSTCTVPVGGGEGDTTTQSCPRPSGSLQPLEPFERPEPPPPRKPKPVLPPVAEPAEPAAEPPTSSTYDLSPPRESDQQGLASWYGPRFHGRRTASGERFDSQDLTAAHRTLAFGTRVCVRSSITGKSVVVRINDRGPFTGGRVIDLSQGAAEALGMIGLGIKPVELWQLDKDEEECPEVFDEAAADADAAAAKPVARVQKKASPTPRKKAVAAPRPRKR
ncbi:septal ring lytic transglycosylase RlpA family protein [Pantoea sp. 18069]|uniref:septal ring lytic transglycosylase RlpA family protein n=1 Tax=Pantoea sp. 18069 TaxID=2681415 RepID=UPI0013588B68|nr:septal ring lytic transglycosylase RlpA family protein [Pantoea sp. 18069]